MTLTKFYMTKYAMERWSQPSVKYDDTQEAMLAKLLEREKNEVSRTRSHLDEIFGKPRQEEPPVRESIFQGR